jgi:acyl-CoA thioester hydrolase
MSENAEGFLARFQVAWGDLDSNSHMANTRYLDYAAQTRFLYLSSAGFTPKDFRQNGLGPVVFKDEVAYEMELRFLDEFTVDMRLAAHSADASRFIIANTIRRADGRVCADIRTSGAWFDLQERKTVAPPATLGQAMAALPRTDDYCYL